MNSEPLTDRPLAQAPFKSYRYAGRYGWIMIGAMDDAEALREAQRSTDDKVTADNLQKFIDGSYKSV